MYTILYMKADYEPWWKFDGWQTFIVTTESYETKDLFEQALQKKLNEFRLVYEHEESKEEKYWAFWSEEESFYCEACEDDAQLYHGIIATETKELEKELQTIQSTC